MTNYEHNKILEAVNECNDLHRSYDSIDEALGIYTFEEILDMVFEYEGIIGYTKWIMRNIEHFYNIEPKTDDELEIY